MIELFLVLHLFSLGIVVALHAGRSRITLAPAFGGCAILIFLMWQLLQTAWWVDLWGNHIHAAIYAPLPAILAGLTMVYAMDGNRAARAYLLTMVVTAAMCVLFNEFLFQLTHFLPIASIFRFPIAVHTVLAISLLGAGLAELLAYEMVRRPLPIPVAMALALLAGLMSFLVLQSVLSYGPTVGLRNIRNQVEAVGLVWFFPAVAAAAYGAMAQRAGLVLPARRLSELFSIWRRAEAELAEVREGFLKASETITELRALNRAVETEQRLREHQVQRSPLGILEIDRRGRITKSNDAAQRLLHLDAPEGVSVESLLPGFGALLADTTGRSTVLPLFIQSGGPARRIQVTAMPLGDPNYGPAFSVLTEDVTDREQLAFAKSVAERVRGIHMTGRAIGHDLSNLMLAVDGNLARVRSALGTAVSDSVEASLRAISDAAQRSRDMLRQLGSQQAFQLPELRACDLRALAEEAVAMQRPNAAVENVRIQVEGPAGVTVAADHTQIVRVLLNLVGNAIRACESGGSIRVELGSDAKGAFAIVRDDGAGMTPDQLERAFDPGFSTKSGGRGGLGLAISYLMIDAHGGHLSLSSEAGLGTTAVIRLPLSTLTVLPAETKPLLLVIADDEARDRCAEYFRSLGGDVIEVATADELAALLAEEPTGWELIIRTLRPPLTTSLRRRLAGEAQILVGRRRAAQRHSEKCRFSSELTRELLLRARFSGAENDAALTT